MSKPHLQFSDIQRVATPDRAFPDEAEDRQCIGGNQLNPEDKTKKQLADELARMRKNIDEIADHLNNPLTVLYGNIGLARIYMEEEATRDKILGKLSVAAEACTEIKHLTRRLRTLANECSLCFRGQNKAILPD